MNENLQHTTTPNSLRQRHSTPFCLHTSYPFVPFLFSTPCIRGSIFPYCNNLNKFVCAKFWSFRIKRRFEFYEASSSAMFFAGIRRLLYLFVVVLMVITVLQTWVCLHSCHVEGIRVFPSNAMANVKFSHGIVEKRVNEDLLHKYFNGRIFGLGNGTRKGFDESKRRVPSCPDPLHN